MRKIVFLVFLSFSTSVFSVPFYSSLYFHEDLNWDQPVSLGLTSLSYLDSLVGTYTHCTLVIKVAGEVTFTDPRLGLDDKSCFIAGWSLINGFHSEYESANPYTLDSYYIGNTITPDTPPICPSHLTSAPYPVVTYNFSEQYAFHSICVSDCSNSGMSPDKCGCPIAASFSFINFYFCRGYPLSSHSVSEQTAKKENDLISESNSKLGSVASSNSANTDLLNKIKNSLSALLSKTYAVFGVDSNASNEPIPLTSEISLSGITPLMSKSGSCPADISISVMNSVHHLSYQPLCDFANKLHPLVIAAARVSAAWLVIGAL